MKDLLFKTSFSKIYIIVMLTITLLVVGGYYSYAMFTITKERNNAISIITGNLDYTLEVDGSISNVLTVPADTVQEFTVTLSNPNNRVARFNFYYVGSLPSNVSAEYLPSAGYNTPPLETGVNLEPLGASGSSNIYNIRIINDSSSSVTITLGVSVGLDYNDLSLPSNGHLFDAYQGELISDVLLASIDDGILSSYDDGIDTFITGEDPNNYIWYSGKLWRAVSINNEEKTVKLVTQWNISAVSYNTSGNAAFAGSFMEEWLNDTTVDGFLYNLRDYEDFIVTDAVWDATEIITEEYIPGPGQSESEKVQRPNGTTTVNKAIGLLNYYEYQSSYEGRNSSNSYLNNGASWWTLTPTDEAQTSLFYINGVPDDYINFTSDPSSTYGVRPSINLKPNVRIVDGNGTIDNPYRLNGDYDTNLNGTLLKYRYSGEYIRFGSGENNLYRIVSHENGIGTKITSAEPLKSNGELITTVFDEITIDYSNPSYSSSTVIGAFLNGDYLTDYVGNDYVNMIEDSTTWYLGAVEEGSSYKLAKYTNTTNNTLTSYTINEKVGLLRLGELMAGLFNNSNYVSINPYWLLTQDYQYSYTFWCVSAFGAGLNDLIYPEAFISPALNLKQNVIITGGDGTLQNPFTLALN